VQFTLQIIFSKRLLLTGLFIVVGYLIKSQELAKVTCNPPAVNFELQNFCFGQTTFFKNLTKSTQKPTYQWLIYKSGASVPEYTNTTLDISYKFSEVATYTVYLIATHADGHSTTLTRILKVDSVLIADFEYTNCQSYFTNYSGCADSFFWDFGDGNYSTEKSPNHLYSYYGLATAKMWARRGDKVDSVQKTFLVIPNNLQGGFNIRKENDTTYFTAHDSTYAGMNEYFWFFGDGKSKNIYGSDGVNVGHVYQKLGRDTTYKVMLLVKSMCYSGFGEKFVTLRDSTVVNGTWVYPNPMLNTNLLRILTEREKEINKLSIHNIMGQPVSQFQIDVRQNGIDVSFDDLPPGVYYVKFLLGTEPKSYKIIRK